MKTLHYVAHIALLTTFVVSSVCIGFYINGSQESRNAIIAIFKKDVHEPVHMHDTLLAEAGDCKVCKELGLSGCTAAVPHRIRGTKAQTNKQVNDNVNAVSLKTAVAIWIKSLIPETVKKDTEDHLEREVLMTYAAWD